MRIRASIIDGVMKHVAIYEGDPGHLKLISKDWFYLGGSGCHLVNGKPRKWDKETTLGDIIKKYDVIDLDKGIPLNMLLEFEVESKKFYLDERDIGKEVQTIYDRKFNRYYIRFLWHALNPYRLEYTEEKMNKEIARLKVEKSKKNKGGDENLEVLNKNINKIIEIAKDIWGL